MEDEKKPGAGDQPEKPAGQEPRRARTDEDRLKSNLKRERQKLGRLNKGIFNNGGKVEADKNLIKPWANWGAKTRFGSGQAQPSAEAKKKGMEKKKRNQELARLILGMKFVGLVPELKEDGKPAVDLMGTPLYTESQFKKRLGSYFGMSAEQIENVDVETALLLRQVGQAIEFGDQQSAQLILNRAYGMPKQHIDLNTDDGTAPTIKVVVVNSLKEAEAEDTPPILEIEIDPEIKINTDESGKDLQV